ncbi:uncharacterized protein TM35_000461040 [Trypanosoma theileri]|uniref:Uncharacterized protein n=1 Tax=Trypanosoma theileri TaxID=67003 RepID=A0A1X0NHS1_9TRYP|nr:uncharacterized protein TM35_000461040 [Trypanosoma theileri]ORC84285.1 hypothetical protein TM35_000461040 [Trypanosoma theileri]
MNDDLVSFFGRSNQWNPDDRKRILADIGNLANSYNLTSRITTWGFTQQSKLCIYGGLPITIEDKENPLTDNNLKQTQPGSYILPIQIWLTHQYPIEPPLIFLLSTEQGCKVSSNHRYVDATGRCHIPELAAWQPGTSTLSAVIKELEYLLEKEGVSPLCIDSEDPSSPLIDSLVIPAPSPHGKIRPTTPESSLTECEESDNCVVCFGPKDTVLVPCGHYCLCGACATNVPQCPLCRQSIKFRQRIFT